MDFEFRLGIAKISRAASFWNAAWGRPGMNFRAGLVLDLAKHMGAGNLCVETGLDCGGILDTQQRPGAGILGCASGTAGKVLCGDKEMAVGRSGAAEKICPRELDMELLNYWLGALSRTRPGPLASGGLKDFSPNAPRASEVAWARKSPRR